MRRTTTRRAARAGLGALAATTALALAAPGASAATSSTDLDPAAESYDFSVFGVPTDPDQAEELDAVPLAEEDETFTLTLPGPVMPGDDALVVEIYEADDYERRENPAPLEVDGLEAEADGNGAVLVTVPREAPEVQAQDDVYVVVEGLTASGFGESSFSAEVALDLVPRGDALELVQEDTVVDGVLVAGAALDGTIAAQAGQPFELVIPEGSTLDSLGVTDLSFADVVLYPADDEVFLLAEEEAAGATASRAAAAAGSPLAARVAAREVAGASPAEALDEAVEAVEAVEEGEDGEDGEVQALDEFDDLFPEVEAEGRTAVVTPSAELETGDYLLELLVPAADDDFVISFVLGDVALQAAPAAAPEPTPTVTATQPAPTTTVTAAPSRQNPGLRSNTGVEDAAPGLSGSGLVVLGSGLLAVAGVTGAAVARSTRRARG